MNLVSEAIQFYSTGGRNWPQSRTLDLLPFFNGGCPWKREYWEARNEPPKILY